MFRKTVILEPNTENKIKKIGLRIKKARLRRNISAETISKKAGIGESTFYAIERGVSTVSIGAYAAVLSVLGLDCDLDVIAVDESGKKLFWEENLVDRKRAKRRKMDKKLPLPIGISDYCKVSSKYYYVDKTLLIRDFIDERPQVSLFTRPCGFGKSLNMDMLRVFFERSEEDTSVYFRDKKIWECGKEYQEYQGKYPVIYVTLKNVIGKNWETAYDFIYKMLRKEFEKHRELLESDKISSFEKQYLTNMLSGNVRVTDVSCALLNLSRMLHVHYGVAPIIIIDVYDAPIQLGYVHGYYDKVVDFMRTLLSSGLKDNPHLSYGFLSGIMRLAKGDISSGLNNIKVNSIFDNRYSEYFGLTPDEVREMAEYYGVSEKYEELSEWYGGYCFGKTEIFSPRSVIEYFNNGCVPFAFRQPDEKNDIISEVLSDVTTEVCEKLEFLIQGKSFVTYINVDESYPQIQSSKSSIIYNFLLMMGYLTVAAKDQAFGENYLYELVIPNKEICCTTKDLLMKYFDAL